MKVAKKDRQNILVSFKKRKRKRLEKGLEVGDNGVCTLHNNSISKKLMRASKSNCPTLLIFPKSTEKKRKSENSSTVALFAFFSIWLTGHGYLLKKEVILAPFTD